MRVGVDARALRPPLTGIGQVLSALLPALGQRCELHLFAPRPIEPFAPPMQAVWHIGPGVKGNIYFHFFMEHRLREAGVDAFLSPLNVLPLRCSIPSVLILHDLTPLEHPGWHRMKTRLTTIPFYDRSFDAASTIACISRETESTLHRLFPYTHGRTVVIPHGFPHPTSEETLLPDNLPQRYILALSTMEPRKNLDLLLRAHATGRDLPPLVVAGAPGWGRKVQARDRVHLLGHVTEEAKWNLLRRADLFVFPSLREGFGLPVWEALAAGTPVVSTDVPSAVEFPHTAVTISEPHPEALLAAMRRVLRVDRPSIPVEGFPSWNETAQRYLDLLEKAALTGPE